MTPQIADDEAQAMTISKIFCSLSIIASLAACGTAQSLPSAKELVDKPHRVEIERQAWNPIVVEPLSSLMVPEDRFNREYKEIKFTPPSGQNVYKFAWMDNRYLIGSMTGGGTQVPTVIMVDSSIGQAYEYATGAFECYRDGKIIFKAGAQGAFFRPGAKDGWFKYGPLGRESSIAAWSETEPGNIYRQAVQEDDCVLRSAPWGNAPKQSAKAVEESDHKTNRDWFRIGLMSEHGTLALRRTLGATNVSTIDTHDLYLLKLDGTEEKLGARYSQDIKEASRGNWAPWLGVYLLSGTTLAQSLAPHRVNLHMEGDVSMGMEDVTIMLLNPKNGEIKRIQRPPYFISNVQITGAFATRAGILWQSGNHQPWGAYISNHKGVRRISMHHITRVAVSPDGCRAALGYYKSAGDFSSQERIQFIDFCN